MESDSAGSTAMKSSACPDTNSPEMSTATRSNDTQTSIIINENDINSSHFDSNAHARLVITILLQLHLLITFFYW